MLATDLRLDLMQGIAGGNLEVRAFDVVHDEPPGAPFDLVAVRALLAPFAGAPCRRRAHGALARSRAAGLFVQEPDFYPTWTGGAALPEDPVGSSSSGWAATVARSTYYVGRKVPARLQEEGLTGLSSRRRAIVYNGGLKVRAVVGLPDCARSRAAEERRRRLGGRRWTVLYAGARSGLLDYDHRGSTATTGRKPG